MHFAGQHCGSGSQGVTHSSKALRAQGCRQLVQLQAATPPQQRCHLCQARAVAATLATKRRTLVLPLAERSTLPSSPSRAATLDLRWSRGGAGRAPSSIHCCQLAGWLKGLGPQKSSRPDSSRAHSGFGAARRGGSMSGAHRPPARAANRRQRSAAHPDWESATCLALKSRLLPADRRVAPVRPADNFENANPGPTMAPATAGWK